MAELKRWVPSAPQEAFLRSSAFEALLAGGSGVGKTDALLAGAARFVHRRRYRALIIARSVGALDGPDGMLERAAEFYRPLGGWLHAPRRCWIFPSSARIHFGACEREESRFDFASWTYQFLGVDGLSWITERVYEFLLTRLRTMGSIPVLARSTSSPDGPFAAWVLRRWRWWLYREGERTDEHAGPILAPGSLLHLSRDAKSGDELVVDARAAGSHSRTCVRATLADNRALASTDYAERLAMLDPFARAQLLDGDWMARPASAKRTGLDGAVPDAVLDFIPWANPGWRRPVHLASFARELEQAFTGASIQRYCTVPPRHYKSETALNAIAWGLAHYPETPVLYATHTATFAYKQSRRAKKLALAAGVELAVGSNRADEWMTTAGGGLVARGVGGEVTGRGFKVIIVDDPIVSRAMAEVATHRVRVWNWLTQDIFTRGTPDASFIVVHTRWMPDDPIGRLIRDDWKGTVLRAIAEDDDPLGRAEGEALCPDQWSVEALSERRKLVGEYGWASLFQGRPQPRGANVFGPPSFYRELPRHFSRAYGVDLAYTASTRADRSVCVEMLREDRHGDAPRMYLAHALVAQEEAPMFAKRLASRQARARAPMLFLCSGTEKGAAQFVEREVPRFEIETVRADKFVRAQDLAADWNDGRVLLPDPEVFDVPWVADLLDVFDAFTGSDDTRDDEVDAAVAAHKLLRRPTTGPLSAYS